MRTSTPCWPAYTAASWLVILAGGRAGWALAGGGTAGGSALTPMDLVAVPLCLLGAACALATVQAWGVAMPPRGVLIGLWTASSVAFLHCAGTISDDLLAAGGLLDLQLRDDADRIVHFVIEPAWLLGAVLCALAALAAVVRADPARALVRAETSRAQARAEAPRVQAAPDMVPCAGERA